MAHRETFHFDVLQPIESFRMPTEMFTKAAVENSIEAPAQPRKFVKAHSEGVSSHKAEDIQCHIHKERKIRRVEIGREENGV